MPRGQAPCPHLAFEATVEVNRLEDTGQFVAHVQVRCANVACGVRFRWIGMEAGLHPAEPRVSVDAFELRGPIEPDAHLTSLMAGGDTGFPSMDVPGPDLDLSTAINRICAELCDGVPQARPTHPKLIKDVSDALFIASRSSTFRALAPRVCEIKK